MRRTGDNTFRSSGRWRRGHSSRRAGPPRTSTDRHAVARRERIADRDRVGDLGGARAADGIDRPVAAHASYGTDRAAGDVAAHRDLASDVGTGRSVTRRAGSRATTRPAPSTPLTTSPATSAPAASRCVEEGAELRYPSGGTTVRGALVRPQGTGPFPAALVLHTRGGLNEHALSEASWLASQGFIAYAPDYFTPVGVTPLSFDRETFTARYSDAVRDLLAGAISCLRERGDVDRTRVGVVGFSMGGYFAAILAARDDVNAAAAWYAAYAGSPANNVPAQHSWTDVAAAAKRPLLLLHGDADPEVRIEFALRAAAELQRLGKQSELVVYPGAGHGYDQQGSSQYAYDAAATADPRARTLALLRAAR